MRAGSLDRRVTVQVLSNRAQDASGQEIEEWTPLLTAWMGKRDIRADERFAGAQVVAEIDAVFVSRWWRAMAEVRPDTHRLSYDGRIWNIVGIREIGRHEGLEFAACARAEG